MDIARDKAVSGGGAPPAAAQSGADSATSRESFARPRPGSSSTAASAGASSSGTARPRDPPPARPSIAQFVSEIRAAFTARFYLFELEVIFTFKDPLRQVSDFIYVFQFFCKQVIEVTQLREVRLHFFLRPHFFRVLQQNF